METFTSRRTIQQALADWRAQDRLGAADLLAAWAPTLPRRAHWHDWLDRALLILGTALLCAGVIVFFAFNWASLHKFSKFGLLAGLLTVLAGFAAWRPAGDMAGRAALGGAQMVSGVLMAVIGQTYQTGADAWQLFALWTLLAVPWALAARAAPHWWIVLVIGNVALLRFCSVRLGIGGMFELLFSARFARETMMFLLGTSIVQLAVWYVLAGRAGRWGFVGSTGPRLLGLLACGYAAWVGLMSVLTGQVNAMGLLVSAVALVGLAAWFRWRAFDIVVLSLVCLTGIGVIVSAVGRWLADFHGDFGAFLLLALLTIGLAVAAATWLLRAWRETSGSPGMSQHPIDRIDPTEQTERGLWNQLAARGTVQGDYAPTLRTPWPIRLLMGGAGWLGALFFQIFLVGTVFATTRGNGPAMAVTGLVMIGIAVALYRVTGRESGRIALGQFALALSLGGQGMVIGGVGEAMGFGRFLETAPFWLGVALFEAVLCVLVPDRLHRFLAVLALWLALAIAACVALGDLIAPRWTAIPMALGPMTALAFAALLAFVMHEDRLAAAGRLQMAGPAADATLLMALLGALVVTGFAHPADLIFGVDTPWRAQGGWLAGALLGAALVAMTLLECRRLACSTPAGVATLAVAVAFSALMVYAPAVTAGALALAMALRRGSLPWLGLAIATVLIGFVWYYSTLQWTLLAKSATLVAAGALLLAARAALGRIANTEAVA